MLKEDRFATEKQEILACFLSFYILGNTYRRVKYAN